jgi:hypothetical protein
MSFDAWDIAQSICVLIVMVRVPSVFALLSPRIATCYL